MYRDKSETHLDDDHSHNFATAFLRNLRCSAVMSISVWVCQAAKNKLNYNTPWLYHQPRTGHTANTRLNTTADSSSRRHTAATELVHGTVETTL
jgi:hypothetical protein